MTFENIALAMIGPLVLIAPLLYAGWLEWLENRPGGAGDYHVRRINELRKELGRQPLHDPATLSWKRAMWEVIHLEDSLELKQKHERLIESIDRRRRRRPHQ